MPPGRPSDWDGMGFVHMSGSHGLRRPMTVGYNSERHLLTTIII